MEIQHVNVKLFVNDGEEVDLGAVIPVFHTWIQDQGNGELLLDVADYRHVRSGPGVVLIGHQGNYSVDNTGGRLGVRYNRKAVLEGTNQDRLVQATQAALAACRRLETEPRLNGKIQFNGREIEVSVNDRLLAPNKPETRQAADSEFHTFFSTLFGNAEYAVSYPQDSRSLFSIHVTTAQTLDTYALLNNPTSMVASIR
ncbi:MAG: hypothetical protein ABSF71_06280 [Terriglobia bacterium]|jgi:hypothetical protein